MPRPGVGTRYTTYLPLAVAAPTFEPTVARSIHLMAAEAIFVCCRPGEAIWTLHCALAILFLTHLPAVRLLIQEDFHEKRGLVEFAILRNIALAKRTQPPSMKTLSTKETRTLCAPQLMHERC
jgi:hypothetical protein